MKQNKKHFSCYYTGGLNLRLFENKIGQGDGLHFKSSFGTPLMILAAVKHINGLRVNSE